jgi:hypothetical protein
VHDPPYFLPKSRTGINLAAYWRVAVLLQLIFVSGVSDCRHGGELRPVNPAISFKENENPKNENSKIENSKLKIRN